MKTSRNQTSKQNKQGVSHRPKPEVRDDLDSRKNEEQDFKGDDLTHNTKETKKDKQKKKQIEHLQCGAAVQMKEIAFAHFAALLNLSQK